MKGENCTISFQSISNSVADLHSKILDACLPGPIFFIFMQFFVNFGKIVG